PRSPTRRSSDLVLAGPRQVHDRIDHDQRTVDALGPQRARHRLGEASLRRLGRSERRSPRSATLRSGRSYKYDVAAADGLHGGDDLLTHRKRAVGVPAPARFEAFEIDALDVPPDA